MNMVCISMNCKQHFVTLAVDKMLSEILCDFVSVFVSYIILWVKRN